MREGGVKPLKFQGYLKIVNRMLIQVDALPCRPGERAPLYRGQRGRI